MGHGEYVDPGSVAVIPYLVACDVVAPSAQRPRAKVPHRVGQSDFLSYQIARPQVEDKAVDRYLVNIAVMAQSQVDNTTERTWLDQHHRRAAVAQGVRQRLVEVVRAQFRLVLYFNDERVMSPVGTPRSRKYNVWRCLDNDANVEQTLAATYRLGLVAIQNSTIRMLIRRNALQQAKEVVFEDLRHVQHQRRQSQAVTRLFPADHLLGDDHPS